MIAFSSAIGFSIVFLAITLASSIVLGSLCLFAGNLVRSLGASAERRASAAVLVVPPVLAAGVTLSLAVRSAASPYFGLADHCADHVHHLHLCVFHGASWGERAWAVAIVAGVGAWLATAFIRGAHALWTARVGLRRIARIATLERIGSIEVLLAPARIPFCFAAGMLRSRIYVSTDAWSRWNDEERRAAVEHERAHLSSRDLVYRLLLNVLALFGAPIVSRRMLSIYDDATERACDRRAANAVGDPTIVASALLACARRDPPIGFCASFLSSSSVERRIEALLADAPEKNNAALILTSVVASLTAALLVCAIVFADPLHHLFESVLG